jgi:hypothetical protein
MSLSPFGEVWGERESAYSGVLAQTLALSPSYRRLFLLRLAELAGASIRSPLIKAAAREGAVETESFMGDLGRMDLLVCFGEVLALGIENKIFAPLQEDQLVRYQHYLRNQNAHYFLIFIAPSAYKLSEEELRKLERERLLPLSYKQLLDWTTEYLHQPGLVEFERRYFTAFCEFIGELEMKPLSNVDVSALLEHNTYWSARKKVEEVIAKLGNCEKHGGFALVWKGDDPFPLLAGVRYSDSDPRSYLHFPLLEGQPEAIAYVKDCEKDSTKADHVNLHLEQCAKNGYIESLGARLEYFPRRKSEECRLALRTPLAHFVEKDPAKILDWLARATTQLEEILRTAGVLL